VTICTAGTLENVYPPKPMISTNGLLFTSAQNDTASFMEFGSGSSPIIKAANVLSAPVIHIVAGLRSATDTHGPVSVLLLDIAQKDIHGIATNASV